MRNNPLIRWQLWVLGGVTLLLLFRVISGPPSREGLVVLERMDAESLQYNAFEVDRTVRMSIEGMGSFESEASDSERLAAYAWILDAETREPVWQMEPANVERGKRTLAELHDTLRLDTGRYYLYFASYGNFLRGRRNGAETVSDKWKKDSKHWHIVMNLVEGKETDVRRIHLDEAPLDMFDGERVVWTSGTLDDHEKRQYIFKLDQPTPFTIRATGEISEDSHDFATINNQRTGEEVWRMQATNTVAAGGVAENRMARARVELDPGVYSFSYQTDATHAYDDWRGNPPFDPAGWGMVVTMPETSEPVTRYDPWENGRPLLSMMPFRDDHYQSITFRVTGKERVVMYGMGEMRRGDRYDFGWIETVSPDSEGQYDADDVDRYPEEDLVVWEMHYDTSTPVGGDDSNREEMAFVELLPDVYRLQYRTDGSHSYTNWSNGEPENGNRWGVALFTLGPGSNDNFQVLNRVEIIDDDEEEAGAVEWEAAKAAEVEQSVAESAVVAEAIDREPSALVFDRSEVLVALNKLGNNVEASERLELQESSRLRVIALGEITVSGNRYDYGYIEKADTGEIVWEMTKDNTREGGGDESNRVFDGTIELAAGTYIVRFITDATHSFGGFNTMSPDMPEAWGITVALAD